MAQLGMAQLGALVARPAAAGGALVVPKTGGLPRSHQSRRLRASTGSTRPVAVIAAERPNLELVRQQELDDETVVFTFGTPEERAAAAAAEQQQQPEPEPQPDAPEATPQPTRGSAVAAVVSTSQEPESPLPEPQHQQEPEFVPDVHPVAVEQASAAVEQPVAAAATSQPAAEQSAAIEQLTTEQPAASQAENNVVTAPAGARSNGKVYDAITLSSMKVVDLRGIAKDHDLKGYSKLKKDDLIHMILTEVKH